MSCLCLPATPLTLKKQPAARNASGTRGCCSGRRHIHMERLFTPQAADQASTSGSSSPYSRPRFKEGCTFCSIARNGGDKVIIEVKGALQESVHPPHSAPGRCDGRRPSCALRSNPHPFPSFVQTERLIVFRDIRPAALCHLQVVPKHHVRNLAALRPCAADHGLLAEMAATGRAALAQLHPGAPQKLGFHRPPFNSVLHLQ